MAEFDQTWPSGYDSAVVANATRWFNAVREQRLASQIWNAYGLTFKMRGQDATTQQVDTWLVSGQPDFTGASYKGPLTRPLRDITIVDTWSTG